MPTDRDSPMAARAGRRRALLIGAVGLGALCIGTLVVNRTAGFSSGGRGTDGSVPVAVRLPAITGSTRVARTTIARRSPSTSRSTTSTPTTVRFNPNGTRPRSGPGSTAPLDTTPPTTTATPTTILAPAVTATLPPPPPPYGASVLTWTAPKSLTMASGTTAPLSVRAYNPTNRAVSLSHPLSCTPRLDHGEMCPDIVQLIGSLRSASAHFTIDASGVAPGRYTLSIEGVLTVNVTVS